MSASGAELKTEAKTEAKTEIEIPKDPFRALVESGISQLDEKKVEEAIRSFTAALHSKYAASDPDFIATMIAERSLRKYANDMEAGSFMEQILTLHSLFCKRWIPANDPHLIVQMTKIIPTQAFVTMYLKIALKWFEKNQSPQNEEIMAKWFQSHILSCSADIQNTIMQLIATTELQGNRLAIALAQRLIAIKDPKFLNCQHMYLSHFQKEEHNEYKKVKPSIFSTKKPFKSKLSDAIDEYHLRGFVISEFFRKWEGDRDFKMMGNRMHCVYHDPKPPHEVFERCKISLKADVATLAKLMSDYYFRSNEHEQDFIISLTYYTGHNDCLRIEKGGFFIKPSSDALQQNPYNFYRVLALLRLNAYRMQHERKFNLIRLCSVVFYAELLLSQNVLSVEKNYGFSLTELADRIKPLMVFCKSIISGVYGLPDEYDLPIYEVLEACIEGINNRIQQIKNEPVMTAFCMGGRPGPGSTSSVRTFMTNPYYDKKLLGMIGMFLGGTEVKEAPVEEVKLTPPPSGPSSSSSSSR